MQQVIQPIDGAATEVADVPTPNCGPGQVLIANRFSLISAGTEKSTVELAKQSLLQKARKRPDHVRRVLEKARTEGIWNTVRQVRAKLAQPMPLGYSSAGVVLEVGANVREFQVGERVASNGPHASVVAVNKNLVARIPDNVAFDHAAYAVVGAIALQGIRLAQVGLGDVVAVIGLGLVGQLTVALLKSAGCVVLGTDLDSAKCKLALEMGADAVASGSDFTALAKVRTGGRGIDAVLITASTPSNAPLELAAEIARPKARLVAVGAVGMSIPRREFYPKELEFVVSCSYGPGRYDVDYEERGNDYPFGYVRWTEQRNIAAVLEQMAAGRINVDKLTSHRFGVEQAASAYELIESGREPFLGILLGYPEIASTSRRLELPQPPRQPAPTIAAPGRTFGISVIGAGNFTSATLLPAFAQSEGFRLRGLISAGGLSGRTQGKRYGFAFAGADLEEALADKETDAVVISTRHHQHTEMGLAALRAGKHVFMEKPLAISEEQLQEWIDGIEDLGSAAPIWTMGFNRRFSPAARLLREAFANVEESKTVCIRFNAGAIPPEHWVHDAQIGGGRIVGEACHAVDLATYLIGSRPVSVYAEPAAPRGRAIATGDDAVLTLRHEDGSVSTIVYASGGERSAGKERVEIFGGGRCGFLDDFRSVQTHRERGRPTRKKWWSQQKGYAEEIAAFHSAIDSDQPPIPYADILSVTSACLRAEQSIRLSLPLEVA